MLGVCCGYKYFFTELNRLIHRINRRIEKAPHRGTKKRIQASPSSSALPPNFPEWAVKEECRNRQSTPSPPPDNTSQLDNSSTDSFESDV